MADFDEELLALAGSGPSTRERVGTSGGHDRRRRSANSSSRRVADDDHEVNGESGAAAAADDDDDEAAVQDEDEEDEKEGDPYPYMGMYKDEEDREYIEDLPELEREEILASRRDEKSRREQKRSLLAMYQTQQGQARPDEGKRGSLSRAGHQAAKRRRPAAADLISDDSGMDEDEGEGDGEEEEDDDEGERGGRGRARRKRSAARRGEEEDEEDEEEEDEEEDEDEGGDQDAGSDYEQDHAPLKKRRAVSGAAASKRDKLKQLSARAKAKKAGAAEASSEEEPQRRGYASTDSDDSEYDAWPRRGGFGDGITGPSGTRRVGGAAEATSDDSEWDALVSPPPIEAVQALKLDRADVMNVMHRPGWERFLRHKFIRFSWGPRLDERGRPVLDHNGRTEEVFRIHEVLGIVRGEEYYELAPGKATNVKVVIRLFGEKKVVDLRFLSNRPFLPSEHERWAAGVRGVRGRFPSTLALRRAAERMAAYRNKAQTPEEIRTLLKNKKEASAAFKAQQQQQHGHGHEHEHGAEGTRHGGTSSRPPPPGPPPARPTDLLPSSTGGNASSSSFRSRFSHLVASSSSLAGAPSSSSSAALRPGRMDESAMAELNEKNRRADRQRILEAEKRRAAAKRSGGAGAGAAAGNGAATGAASAGSGSGSGAAGPLAGPLELPPGEARGLLAPELTTQLTAWAEKAGDHHALALLAVEVDVEVA